MKYCILVKISLSHKESYIKIKLDQENFAYHDNKFFQNTIFKIYIFPIDYN